MYKYDIHVHTANTSSCARASGAEQARAYKEVGFTGIVITDHYERGYFERNSYPTWKETMDRFFAGYFAAKEEGDRIGLDVFQCAEVTLATNGKDYLVLGLTPDFFYRHERLFLLTEEQFLDLVHSEGGLVFAAHPFRYKELYPYGNIDGVEVTNGNPYSHNDMAMEYAKERGLLISVGSDAHKVADAGVCGIITDTKVTSVTQFAEILKSGSCRLIHGVWSFD